MNKETKSYLHGAYNVVGEGATDGKRQVKFKEKIKQGRETVWVWVYMHTQF